MPKQDLSKSNYDVAFSAIEIRNTRSRHQDTLYLRILVSVDGVDKGTATWDGTGGRDKNNGYYDTLRNAGKRLIGVSTGPISESSVVKVTFVVLNSGHTPNEDDYSKALAAISAAAAKLGSMSVWAYVVSALTGVLSFLVGANCDGPVAADQFKLTGKEIKDKIGVNSYYNWTDPSGYIGPDSPAACGSNSNYSCTIQFTRHAD